MNVTALLAHPDDELACAGTLAKFVDDEANVTLITVFSGNDRGSELHQSAEVLGVELWEFYHSQGDFVWNRDQVQRYEDIVGRTAPDLLISHRIADNNTSHAPLAQIARTLARKNKMSLWEIDAALPGGIETDGPVNNLLVDIDPQAIRKLQAIECYRSVLDQYPGLDEAFTMRDLHNGWLLHMEHQEHYAEALRVVKSVWR